MPWDVIVKKAEDSGKNVGKGVGRWKLWRDRTEKWVARHIRIVCLGLAPQADKTDCENAEKIMQTFAFIKIILTFAL